MPIIKINNFNNVSTYDYVTHTIYLKAQRDTIILNYNVSTYNMIFYFLFDSSDSNKKQKMIKIYI